MRVLLALDSRRAQEWVRVDARLISIVTRILLPNWPMSHAIVTSIYRSPAEEEDIYEKTGYKPSGIHSVGPPFRAVDIHVLSWDDEGVMKVVQRINREWQYDVKRPRMRVALYVPHGTAPHVHLQVHPRTMRRPAVTERGLPEEV